MIAADTGRRPWREEQFRVRDVLQAEALIRDRGGVIQGPYLLPWVPMLARDNDALVVYMRRDPAQVEDSLRRLRAQRISLPLFSKHQADRLWLAIRGTVAHYLELDYASLAEHPLWVGNRTGFHHRQTRR